MVPCAKLPSCLLLTYGGMDSTIVESIGSKLNVSVAGSKLTWT